MAAEMVGVIQAHRLEVGDCIVNLGTVVAVGTLGAFTVVRISRDTWSLIGGQQVTIQDEFTWHDVDEVCIRSARD